MAQWLAQRAEGGHVQSIGKEHRVDLRVKKFLISPSSSPPLPLPLLLFQMPPAVDGNVGLALLVLSLLSTYLLISTLSRAFSSSLLPILRSFFFSHPLHLSNQPSSTPSWHANPLVHLRIPSRSSQRRSTWSNRMASGCLVMWCGSLPGPSSLASWRVYHPLKTTYGAHILSWGSSK